MPHLADPGVIAWILGSLVALLVAGGAVAFAFWYTGDDQTEI